MDDLEKSVERKEQEVKMSLRRLGPAKDSFNTWNG
jgi:hypothetical protein